MPIFGLTSILAIIAIVHVIKTDRSQLWIMVLLGLPGIGVLAYVIVEVLPEFVNGKRGHSASKNLGKVLNPNHSIEQAKREFSISGSVKNATNLADVHFEKEQFADAASLYRGALVGVNEQNPDIMHKLAACELALNNFDEARSLLDQLIENNPNYKNQDAHLLYARALEALGEFDSATEEYEALVKYYTGPEPSYRFGLMLAKQGNNDRAQELFRDNVEKAELSPKHYRKMHHEWIRLSETQLKD